MEETLGVNRNPLLVENNKVLNKKWGLQLITVTEIFNLVKFGKAISWEEAMREMNKERETMTQIKEELTKLKEKIKTLETKHTEELQKKDRKIIRLKKGKIDTEKKLKETRNELIFEKMEAKVTEMDYEGELIRNMRMRKDFKLRLQQISTNNRKGRKRLKAKHKRAKRKFKMTTDNVREKDSDQEEIKKELELRMRILELARNDPEIIEFMM